MFEIILLFIVGLVLLIKGADLFVKSAASIAEKLGVSEMIIGLTLVAVGTSVPEIASAVTSSLHGQNDLITGNIVGSNIANIGLILGVAALTSGVKIGVQTVSRDGYILMFSTALFYVSVLNRRISFFTGALFLLLYLGYILFLFEANIRKDGEYHFREFVRYFFGFQYLITLKKGFDHGLGRVVNGARNISEMQIKRLFEEALLKDMLLVVIGLAAVVLGAKYFIEGAVYISEAFNLPKTFVGVLLSLGTTMPELGVSLMAARKGYGDIAIGNIIGSNITNILLIIGLCAVIYPINIAPLVVNYTVPYLLFMTMVSFFLLMTRREITRNGGVVLLFLYCLFMLLLAMQSLHL